MDFIIDVQIVGMEYGNKETTLKKMKPDMIGQGALEWDDCESQVAVQPQSMVRAEPVMQAAASLHK